ncbi:MAG: bifunctional folylpolyglutamate synthase/dihydrofolate synthase [Prevotella sp.]|nr:bifunctional folylpolyglutamate synthase/dihydrofolate synthase [Prevotella sp.]
MTYKETVEYLYNCTPVFEKIGAGAYKEGLSNTHALDTRLGHPHRLFKTIHVAGTNGKGSVSHSIASILQEAGLRVGLYTSPHLVDFRERIRINGVCISEEYVVDFVAHHRDFFEPLHPSFFELTTAMAFDYFAKQAVDVAVVEVGLGGRLDCTNIITPDLCVITNISLDHTQFLGDTVAKIAAEKAGIIKPGIPVVIGEATEETRPVFEAKAAEAGAPITFAEDHPFVIAATDGPHYTRHYLTQPFGDFDSDLGGHYQTRNTDTILHAISLLQDMDYPITTEDIRQGLGKVCRNTGLMGRWQQVGERPTVVLDTGHNVGGWQWLARQLREVECRRMRIVFGMVDDKDLDTVMGLLPPDADYYFTRASSHRAIDEEKVRETGEQKGLHGQAFHTVKEAFEAARRDAAPEDFIFVGGSSYVVADFLGFYRIS